MHAITNVETTWEQLYDMPRDGMRRELVRGELRTMNPANFEHGAITVELTWRLAQFVSEKKLGCVVAAETGFLLAQKPDTVLAPDIAFVVQARIDKDGIPKKFYPGAPDLAVEVLSPSDTVAEVEEKVAAWLARGARVVWVVNPKLKTVTSYRSSSDVSVFSLADTLEAADLLPGFRCSVAELFPEG